MMWKSVLAQFLVVLCVASAKYTDVAVFEYLTSEHVVIDCRSPTEFAKERIPNAANIYWKEPELLGDEFLLVTDNTTAVEDIFQASGIRNDSPVLLYGDNIVDAARMFWMLEYFGHDWVLILDGGFAAWKAAGYDVETGDPTPPLQGNFVVMKNVDLRALLEEVAQEYENTDHYVILDARSHDEYIGEKDSGEARRGHIPNALNLPFGEFFDLESKLRDYGEIKRLLRTRLDYQYPRDKRTIITLCTGGVRSSVAYSVIRHAEVAKVTNFDGSMLQWAANSDLPMVKENLVDTQLE